MLRLLGEVDARELWARDGSATFVSWCSWKLGLTPGTAREKIRVARALRELPRVAAELAAGRMTYAQARAVTRVAVPGEEERWIGLARYATAAQLERAARGVRRARREPGDEAPARPDFVERWDDNGDLLLTVRVPAAHAPAVLARVEQARAAEQVDRDALYAELGCGELVSAEASGVGEEPPPYAEPYEFVDPPLPRTAPGRSAFEPRTPEEDEAVAAHWEEVRRRRRKEAASRAWQDHQDRLATTRALPARRATNADGLLRAITRPEGLKATTVQLLVDPASGWTRSGRDELYPPGTLQQVLRTLPGRSSSLRPLTEADRRHADLGRTGRTVSPALRRLLGQLDGERCRFPSCDRTRNLHAHHVVFWRHGGRTDLANLVLVCARHHTLIHEQGFQLVLSPDRTLTVRTRDDIPVPQVVARPHGDAGELPTADPYVSQWGNDPFRLDYVVMVMAQHSG